MEDTSLEEMLKAVTEATEQFTFPSAFAFAICGQSTSIIVKANSSLRKRHIQALMEVSDKDGWDFQIENTCINKEYCLVIRIYKISPHQKLA